MSERNPAFDPNALHIESVRDVPHPTIDVFVCMRVLEDQVVAQAATPAPWSDLRDSVPADDTLSREDAAHVSRHDPARVLAECAAKLEMIEVLAIADAMDQGPDRIGTADHLLRTMASVYADHPGYREEWR